VKLLLALSVVSRISPLMYQEAFFSGAMTALLGIKVLLTRASPVLAS